MVTCVLLSRNNISKLYYFILYYFMYITSVHCIICITLYYTSIHYIIYVKSLYHTHIIYVPSAHYIIHIILYYIIYMTSVYDIIYIISYVYLSSRPRAASSSIKSSNSVLCVEILKVSALVHLLFYKYIYIEDIYILNIYIY